MERATADTTATATATPAGKLAPREKKPTQFGGGFGCVAPVAYPVKLCMPLPRAIANVLNREFHNNDSLCAAGKHRHTHTTTTTTRR